MKHLQKFGYWLIIGGAALYSMGLVVLTLLWTFAPQIHWSITFSDVFAALFFVPILVLIPAALILRTRLMLAMTLTPIVLFALLFGGRFIPRAAVLPTTGQTLRVVTYNQLFVDTNADAIIATIRAQNADLVAIQELAKPVSEQIQRDLKTLYPYQILDPSNSQGGLGILSRYPLDDAGMLEGTGAQRAIMHVNGKDIVVVNVHLHFSGISRVRSQAFGSLGYFRMYDTKGRLVQAEALLAESRKATGGFILLGDHNTGDREPGYQLLASELHDAFGEKGWGFGFTFPNNKRMGPITIPIPLVRIDYVWSKNGITPLSAHVECQDAGSDHCLLVADLHIES
ncbi:MAG: endonuclease/exonuclease/phosphatase family protein [Roseiflexaceae bacterium]|nr:endonuclease/exonuclease/phosphatase family protein [Roseiflexaceae bacterium]